MIAREVIQAFFEDNQVRGVDFDRVLRWGFFVVDASESKLEALLPTVQELGYRFVKVLAPESDQQMHFLHLERDERHSADSLYRCINELDKVARRHRVVGVDGFDVGNLDGAPLF